MTWRWLKYLSLIVLLFSTVSNWAAAEDKGNSKRLTTEQLLNHLRSIKNPSLQPAVSDGSIQDGKCGFGIRAQVINRWQEFSQEQRAELSLLMKANVTQSDTIAGHFHIFYDTTGINEPALLDSINQRILGTAKAYIQYVAQIFNHVWDVEVDQMGYSAPPFESGQSYYNIFVTNVTGEYGSTTPILQINGSEYPPRYTSYITIDNDYRGFTTFGIRGLEVTAAHEFHHAIQMGSYGLFDIDKYRYVHELTSTWMEDVVYTDVNDYYNYLPDYFGRFSDGRAFNSNPGTGGYERCVWALFMAKQFSANVMRSVWEAMRNSPYQADVDVFLESNAAVLANMDTTLQTAFSIFTKWNYFTWDRADTINYYSEGNHYPRFQPLQKIAYFNTSSTTSGNVEPFSSSMYEFNLQQDTITAVIANVDIGNAIMRNTTQQKIDVTLSSQSLSQPYIELANGLKVKIAVDNLSLWRPFFMQEAVPIQRLQFDAAPNPFRLAEAQKLYLPINEDNASLADVYIYNSTFDLAYSGQFHSSFYENGGTYVIEVPASAIKSKLSSGIYFILAKTVNKSYKWKLAVIR
ncbi:MAG: hypothetical protein NTX44_02455 [Ignavibacteriales bacterium]|nr:hypothetical protein [Ignavibacteriales bacterium]